MAKLRRSGQTLTINNGATASGTLQVTRLCQSVTIVSPDTLPETISVQVAVDDSGWAILRSGTTDVTVVAARAAIILNGGFTALRLLAGSAVGADRTFTIGVMAEESQGSH